MSHVSHLECVVCGATFAPDVVMNLCPRDQRPVRVVHDLARIRRLHGPDGWWRPQRRSLWRFGALLPLDPEDPADAPDIVSLGEGHTPSIPFHDHPLARSLDVRLEVKDEGKPRGAPWGANPTLSFKDRGMTMTVSMARARGLRRLAVPTQGNAGDSLATYAVAAGDLDVVVVMSPDTDRPVLANVAALAALHPDRVRLELVPGTIVDCGARVRDHLVPLEGRFSVATFQEPGWRIEGKKTLGLEMAEPTPERPQWQAPDVVVYPTGGGTGVLGMHKAFSELRQLGLLGPDLPRFVCVQSAATEPLTRAFQAGAPDIEPLPAGTTIATGLNVARNPGHVEVLRIVRETGGTILSIEDDAIRAVIADEWRARRFAWSPEGAAALAALPRLAESRILRPGDRVVVVNTAAAEKYLPAIRDCLDGGL